MVDARTEKHRRIRGAILKLLSVEHPGTVDLMVLRTLIDRVGYPTTEEGMRSYVSYLEEEGYVKRETRKVGKLEIAMVAITAKGLRLLDGYLTDDGVAVEFLNER